MIVEEAVGRGTKEAIRVVEEEDFGMDQRRLSE